MCTFLWICLLFLKVGGFGSRVEGTFGNVISRFLDVNKCDSLLMISLLV